MADHRGGPVLRDEAPSEPPLRPRRAAGTRTIGVTIPMPEPYRSHLQTHRASYGDPAADTIPPHITLMPPTQVDPLELADLIEHIEQVAASRPPFVIVLAGTGTFRPVSPVVFVQLLAGATECGDLERALRAGPLSIAQTFAYHPHVTVAHHVDDAALDRAERELASFAGSFVVQAFEIDELAADEHWQTLRAFPLKG